MKQEDYILELEKSKMDLYIQMLQLKETEARRKGYIRIFIGTFLGIIVSVCLFFLFTKEIPAGNKDVVIALVSGLTGAFFGSVVTYYFGDSDSRNDMPTTPAMESPKMKKTDEEEIIEIEKTTGTNIQEAAEEYDFEKE